MKAMKFLFLTGVLFVLMVGCSKEKSSSTEPKHFIKTSLPCANSANPYDTVGYMHNQMVSYLTKHLSSSTVNDSLLFYSSLYLYSLGDPRNIDSTVMNTPAILNWYTNYTVSIDFSTFLTNIQQEFNTSRAVKDYLDSINQKLSLPANSVNNAIISVENEILNDNTLSSGDQHTLLVVAAIARYSFYYWTYDKKKATCYSSWVLGDLMGGYYGLQYGWYFGWWGPLVGAAIGSTIAALGN